MSRSLQMTFSCGDAFAMQGEYWMQEPRLHVAKFLSEHVEKAVRMFKDTSKTKRLPEHVVVFRGGVSEGEYAKVRIFGATEFIFFQERALTILKIGLGVGLSNLIS